MEKKNDQKFQKEGPFYFSSVVRTHTDTVSYALVSKGPKKKGKKVTH